MTPAFSKPLLFTAVESLAMDSQPKESSPLFDDVGRDGRDIRNHLSDGYADQVTLDPLMRNNWAIWSHIYLRGPLHLADRHLKLYG